MQGTKPVKQLLDEIAVKMVDESKLRWTAEEMVSDFNEAVGTIISAIPSAHLIDVINHQCTAGSRQLLPDGALALHDIPEANGVTVERLPTAQMLDDNFRGWKKESSSNSPTHFIYDPENPMVFWLYPGVIVDTIINLSYSATPTRLTWQDCIDGAVIPLHDTYISIIKAYIYSRLYSKAATYANKEAAYVKYTNEYTVLMKARIDAIGRG